MDKRFNARVQVGADTGGETVTGVRARPSANRSDCTFAPGKKKVSIETLLTWAYADQMVHVAQSEAALVVGASRMPRGYHHAPLEAVDSSGGGGWFTASPDAFVVHEIVSALSTVQAHLPHDCVGRLAPGVSMGTVPVIEEAFTVRRAALVMTYAIDAKRPDWIAEPALAVERRGVVYARSRNGTIKRDRTTRQQVQALCLVRFVGDMPWEIARARVLYALWVEALGLVLDRMRGRALAGFVVGEELPPIAPWLLTCAK